MKKKILVSGIQPTGNLHIGNYLGAVNNWVNLQNFADYEMYIIIVDLHALTGNMKAVERRKQIIRTSAELLASGIDPNKTTFFVQSHVPQHTELAWIFNCITPMTELERMTQFKDKSARQVKNINTGLFTYPILQAADILLYHGEVVPVGEDQIQHIELTRDIGRWFNNRYGDLFKDAKPFLTNMPKVMSLLDPEKKMSKSLGEGHIIELADSPEVVEKKIKKAVTATEGGGDAPGVQNLLLLLEQFGDKKLVRKFKKAEDDGSIRYGDLKAEVSVAISDYFADFRKRREELMMDTDKLFDILSKGAKKASERAEETMVRVRKKVGIK